MMQLIVNVRLPPGRGSLMFQLGELGFGWRRMGDVRMLKLGLLAVSRWPTQSNPARFSWGWHRPGGGA